MNRILASRLFGAWLLLHSTATPAQIPSNDLPLRIGADQAGGNVFHGEIAAVRLYSRALTTAELASLAKAPRDGGGTVRGCVGEWLHPKLPSDSEQKFDFSEGCTIEAWVRLEAGTSGRIVDKITPGGSDGFLLDTHPGDALRLIVGNETLAHALPHDGGWTHVAATVDAAGRLALFVNGVYVAGTATDPGDVTVRGAAGGPGGALTLWYRRPAGRWTEACPVGNGRLGGMVWGGVKRERIDLNEDTLWSGEPYDNLNPRGLAALPEIRRLLREGNDKEAQRLVERDMNGKYNQSYQPLGDLTVEFPFAGEVTDYRRELDLANAVARVQFEHQGVRYTREVFVSNPAQAVVVRLASDRPGMVSFTASLGCQLHHATKAASGCLRLTGRCPAHVEPSYSGEGVVWEDGPEGKGMRFETRLAAVSEGGRVAITDEAITGQGCDSVMLLLVAATSYNGPWKSPSREGKDPGRLCDACLAPLAGATYAALRAAHVADYQSLFNRVTLDLGRSDAEKEATDLRVQRYQPGRDPSLAALYYQFGRYLLIASSRTGTQPANLQGIWNHQIHPPWSANWTLNCNAQINYWPVETANLAECHLPLVELTEQLSADGAHVARGLYGARGWVAHHNTDIWRQAGPVSGSALWSIFQVGSAWLCQHLWEHYAFSGDAAYLARVWPTMRGAARFYLDDLMEEPSHGWLVTGPDTNFENGFRKPDGETGCVCLGPTGSMEMVRELFQNCIRAARILGTDTDLRAEIEKTLPRLPPLRVSPTTGELQEWIEDWQRTAECQVLSSWGAVCGTQITPRGTPELAAALRRIFDRAQWWKRGLVGSWQGAFQANTYARLGDGDAALAVLDTHLQRSVNPNMTAHFKNAGAEFEIDGNLGQTAAIGEMLMQSHAGEIELLPALPRAWAAGKVIGLRARGGFTVDLEWKGNRVTNFRITSASPRSVKVRVNGEEKTVTAEARR
ncbi:MAG: glycosyl hydrolase family 95 catalytic domain-containing protein [Limisphaerales bacterium]